MKKTIIKRRFISSVLFVFIINIVLMVGCDSNSTQTAGETNFIFPVNGGEIIEYGHWDGGSETYKGIKIEATESNEILAAADGEVVFAEWYAGYGLSLMIQHDDLITTLYAHCDELLVDAGDYVTQGQSVAMVGATGTTELEALHFEIIIDGINVNPMDYINK